MRFRDIATFTRRRLSSFARRISNAFEIAFSDCIWVPEVKMRSVFSSASLGDGRHCKSANRQQEIRKKFKTRFQKYKKRRNAMHRTGLFLHSCAILGRYKGGESK
jgi:hypothetical protein